MTLMDIRMPVLDGLEATSQIRSMDVDVLIVALTANALKGDAETYSAAGMNDHIGNPVHQNQLQGVLWKWMGAWWIFWRPDTFSPRLFQESNRASRSSFI